MKSQDDWLVWNRQRLSKAKAKLATATSQLTNIQAQLDDPDYYYKKFSRKKGENLKIKVLPEEIPTNEEVENKTSTGWD